MNKNNYTVEEILSAINEINDLRSIRFMRMLLSGFSEDIVFRFGTLDLVRGDWRRYNKALNENIIANENTTVDISTVNILESLKYIKNNYLIVLIHLIRIDILFFN